ncbi:4097_t:CDS:2, partial [Scutellospora calospora]
AICKAYEYYKYIFEKEEKEGLKLCKEDQEVMTYKDLNKNIAWLQAIIHKFQKPPQPYHIWIKQ